VTAAEPSVLADAARRRQQDVTRRIVEAIATVKHRGEAATVAAVSREARVSRTSIYARPNLLEQLHSQPPQRVVATAAPTGERPALLRRLEVSQQRNRKLHEENDRLRRELARALGEVRRLRHEAASLAPSC
jgi:uncharacterized protein DUF6262